MMTDAVANLLLRLNSNDSEDAWREFLHQYSPLIYQVIRYFEADADRAGDCFQFVCEQLIDKNCKKLRKFDSGGRATFTTWLRAVTRNICIDWHRKEFGRKRMIRSVSTLSNFDQEVFKLVYERGIPLEETLMILGSAFNNVTTARLIQSTQRIDSVLTPHHRWLLSKKAGGNGFVDLADTERLQKQMADAADPRPDPEAQAYSNERRTLLMRTLGTLSTEDQLLVRMRFEQELTLEELATVLGLGNAQRVDRKLKEVLSKLRRQLGQG